MGIKGPKGEVGPEGPQGRQGKDYLHKVENFVHPDKTVALYQYQFLTVQL